MTHQTTHQARIKRATSVPYYFSSTARDRQEDLRVSDYVRVSGLDGKYEIVDIFPRYGSIRIRPIGCTEGLVMPWHHVRPWKEKGIRSRTVMRAVGDWLFGGNRVYRLSEPDRVLRQRKIHWDSQTCDVEDEDGRVLYDVSWDELEFWDDVELHLADDD